MVFIEERHKFVSSLEEQPKQMALYSLLSNKQFINRNDNVSETDAIYYASIHSIINNSRKEFNIQYHYCLAKRD